ncbi:MAG: hypothetical protein WEB00_15455 [Dehalococcoidia bacterium]
MRRNNDILEESDRWDTLPPEEVLALTEPINGTIEDRRPPKQAISLRIDSRTVEAAKRIGERLGVGYQTLFRIWILQGLARERGKVEGAGPAVRPRRRAKTA